MPQKSKRACRYPGCPKLTYESYCDKHKKEKNKEYNRYHRDPESNKRYGRAWKKIRNAYVQLNPLCEICKQNGRLKPVEEVHHIVPLSEGGVNEFSNLISLCHSCHIKAHITPGILK